MPIWGVMADVHGNLPALRRAVELCRARGAERFAFLGDLLGRGDSDGCVELIRALAEASVVGNRDLDWQDRVGPSTREYVLGLPVSQRAADFLAIHGDARLDRDLNTGAARRSVDGEYRSFSRAYRRLAREDARIGLFGHSHQARIWRLRGPEEGAEILYDGAVDPRPAIVDISSPDPETRYVVNVGTTGLPFGGKGPPSCAVYDPGKKTIEIVPLGYRTKNERRRTASVDPFVFRRSSFVAPSGARMGGG